MQILFVGMVWWAAIRVRPKEIGRLLTGGLGTKVGGNSETPG